MELLSLAVLEYESKRRNIQQRYRLKFRSWGKNLSRSYDQLYAKLLVLAELSNPNSTPFNPRPHFSLYEDIRDLVSFCSRFVSDTVFSFAFLLRIIGIGHSKGKEELNLYIEALLAETYEQKWLPALRLVEERWPSMKQKPLSETTLKLWPAVRDCILESCSEYGELWSHGIKRKEVQYCDFIEKGNEILKRLEEKLDSMKTLKNGTGHKQPSGDETVIILAINEHLQGEGFCRWLDSALPPVKPRQGWIDPNSSNPKWPGSYLRAYTAGNVKIKKSWQKKIQDYKNDVQTKFPRLIHRKMQRKNSPTRQGE